MKRDVHNPQSHSTKEVVEGDLTTVELLWLAKRIENRIRFGRSVSEKLVDRNRRVLSFAPGSIFAFVRWTSNDFGTVLSRIDILRAPTPGQRYSTVPWIKPGGESLLRLSGWPKVERVLQLIEQYEPVARGIFSGTVGYITPDGDFDFNVVIRSIMYNQATKYLSCQVGSGITFYSDAEQEWEECLLKASAMKKVLTS